jgi:hypothetical protein
MAPWAACPSIDRPSINENERVPLEQISFLTASFTVPSKAVDLLGYRRMKRIDRIGRKRCGASVQP